MNERAVERAERLVREAQEVIDQQRSILSTLDPGSNAAAVARQALYMAEDLLAMELDDLAELREGR